MRAVVTAGGTSEPIDDVRVITNLSTGRFGAALANALAERGIDVTLLAGRALSKHPEWVDRRVRIQGFGSYAELDAALSLELSSPPELLFMAAAVSDYSPIRSEGKIRSDADELRLVLRRNPKLLSTLRARCGVKTFLVGFKLLSGVPVGELVATARRQIAQERLNLCVANDLAELAGPEHPVFLVTPEGGALRRTGTKPEVAAQVVDFACRRAQTRWHRSVSASLVEPPGREAAGALLEFAIESSLLTGRDGNVSHRAGKGLIVTPRQVVKAELTPAELLYAEVSGGVVSYQGEGKPSIDTSVHAWLYRQLPRLQALLHCHDALVLPTAETQFPWPCGSTEEAEEIGRALIKAQHVAAQHVGAPGDARGFAVRLVDHGSLIGITDIARLLAEWRSARAGYEAHLSEVGFLASRVRPTPVFDGSSIVGICAEVPEHGAWSSWIVPELRGAGRGDRIAEALDGLGRTAAVGEACGVLEWYRERGWTERERQGHVICLDPPSRRKEWIKAASICLLAPDGRVLLGRRLTGQWPGHWAFPGGRCDASDSTPLATALRELGEETGIALEWASVERECVVHVGDYAVHNFLVPVLTAPEPTPSAELDAHWMSRAEAAALRPMAAGTRRILRGLG